jgi:hypothetical protein
VDIESAPLQRVRVFDAFRHRAFFTALGWRAFTLVGSSRLGIVFRLFADGKAPCSTTSGTIPPTAGKKKPSPRPFSSVRTISSVKVRRPER